MKRLTDKSFVYVPACATDIAKTFERIIAEQKAKAERAPKPHIVPIKREASK